MRRVPSNRRGYGTTAKIRRNEENLVIFCCSPRLRASVVQRSCLLSRGTDFHLPGFEWIITIMSAESHSSPKVDDPIALALEAFHRNDAPAMGRLFERFPELKAQIN